MPKLFLDTLLELNSYVSIFVYSSMSVHSLILLKHFIKGLKNGFLTQYLAYLFIWTYHAFWQIQIQFLQRQSCWTKSWNVNVHTGKEEWSCFKCYIFIKHNPAHIYMFKVKTRNFRKTCEICSKLTIKIPERRHRHRNHMFHTFF